MNKVEFSEILNLLLAENQEEASEKLHEWFVSQSKTILEGLQESEADESADEEVVEEGVTITIDTDEEGAEFAPVIEPVASAIPTELPNEEFVDEADEDFGDDDFGGDADVELPVGDEAGEEFAGDDFGGEEAPEEDLPVEDRVEDLEAQLAALQAEFAELMGTDAEEAGEEAADDAEEAGEEEEEEVEEGVEGFTNEQFVAEDDDFANLEESFELTKVKDPDMSEGSQAGDGGKAQVSKDSPIPQKKPEARVGGAAVEVKGKTHKGYAREASPGVNTKPILKNQVSNAKQDLTPVSPEGDKSALLNKGPAADKGKSPIGGGAVDLRGDDMKRKK